MANIQQYEQRVTAQGSLGARATGDDFGAQVGRAEASAAEARGAVSRSLSNVGQGMMDLYAAQRQQEIQQELTRVYTDTSDARVKLLTDLKQASQNAAPGDQTFIPKYKEAMDETLANLSGNYTTQAGQREFARISASMKSDYMARAVELQANITAAGVKVDNAKISTNNGSVVFNDPSMLKSVLQQRFAEIDNPESLYGQLSVSERAALKAETERDLTKAAKMGEITANPAAFLAKVAPDVLQKFNRSSSTVADFTTTPPNVNTKVASLAPVIQENATKYGVDPNILSAQIMQESGGKSNVTSPKGAAGISQFMPDTARQYNVDVTDDKSSIRGQANMMADMLKQFGGDYQKALAAYNWGPGNLQNAINKWGVLWMDHAPAETKNYVATIMGNAGIKALTGEPPVAQQAPVKIGDPTFDSLPWHDQYQIIQTAQQHFVAQQVQDQHRVAEAERLRKQAASDEMNNMITMLEEGKLTPKMVTGSQKLDPSQRLTMLHAIQSKANKLDDTRPEVMNAVLQQVIDNKITDPQELWNYVGKGLSLTDITRMQGIVNGKGTPVVEQRKSFMSMAKSQISGSNPMMGIADPEGDKQYYSFVNELNHVIEEKQKAGVTMTQMLDARADNREYLGYLVDKYKRSPKERMEAAANIVRNSTANVSAAPNIEPRRPGETIDQYNARTRGF